MSMFLLMTYVLTLLGCLRRRRTKAEMEADRLAELERKAEKARLQALGTEEKKPRKRRCVVCVAFAISIVPIVHRVNV